LPLNKQATLSTEEYTRSALEHIRYLSDTISGRGSCTPAERQAADYTAEQLHALNLQDVRIERYRGAPSTYRPYVLAFVAALIGTIAIWLFPGRLTLALGAMLNALGTWAMLAESDFSANWTRWLLPKGESQNVVAVVPPSDDIKHRIVLCAHLDSHRTPIRSFILRKHGTCCSACW